MNEFADPIATLRAYVAEYMRKGRIAATNHMETTAVSLAVLDELTAIRQLLERAEARALAAEAPAVEAPAEPSEASARRRTLADT